MANSPPNQHVVEYLNYYTSLERPPQFAVLISGQWGSGKKNIGITLKIKAHANGIIDELISRGASTIKPALESYRSQILRLFASSQCEISASFALL